ncbi:hypothetical protein [Rodentibacter haemolyticus]|uniref:Uncharacterized protein n=1 Tax=Rodentibacter haemolyticus TaxID=2778911 RepID=A0ABX6UX29_9PAST|nr:hypothetical protein [Rodentibacter haemolyticus]QPB42662.1 hypothetical protein IHV77_00605 [Rodentibacter haemolyticus]
MTKSTTKPKRKIKPFYIVTGTAPDGGRTETIAEFKNKSQILKGLRQQGLDFDKYQEITIRKSPITVYEYLPQEDKQQ